MSGFLLAATLVSLGATGNWSGTYTFDAQLRACGGKAFHASGNAALTLLQNGGAISGRLDLANFLRFQSTCSATNGDLTRVVVGSANGSSIFWTFPNDGTEPRFTGTIDDHAINVRWTDGMGADASVSLTRIAAAPPSADFTGAWKGNYSFTDSCTGSRSRPYGGDFTLALRQSGASASGVVTMRDVPLVANDCTLFFVRDATLTAAGSVSGSTFTGILFDPSGTFTIPITAAIDRLSLNGAVANGNTRTSGTFKLAQSDDVAPASGVGGTYEGSYSETFDESSRCLNIQNLTFGGSASVVITQAGDDASGWLTLHDAEAVRADFNGTCTVVPVADIVVPVRGAIANNAMTIRDAASANVYTFRFDGSSIDGRLEDPNGNFATVTVTRTAGGRRRGIAP